MWIECTFVAELHHEKLAVQTCHKSCADSGSDTHIMLTHDFVTGGKSVNILGPINGLAMSNLGKANFGMASFALKAFSRSLAEDICFSFMTGTASGATMKHVRMLCLGNVSKLGAFVLCQPQESAARNMRM